MVLILPNIVHRLVSEYLYWFEPPQIDSSSMKTFLEGKTSSTARDDMKANVKRGALTGRIALLEMKKLTVQEMN
jgi:hypothetical protein